MPFSTQSIAGYTGEIPVAVKTLSGNNPELVKKFMEEADLMRRFSHPNIVSLLGRWSRHTQGTTLPRKHDLSDVYRIAGLFRG